MNPPIQETIENVRQWGVAKGITGPDGKATVMAQLNKSQEELNEARDAAAVLAYHEEHDVLGSFGIEHLKAKLKDGVGDTAVTLILLAELAGMTFEECLLAAYNEIKGRTGQMIDGQFVKDSN